MRAAAKRPAPLLVICGLTSLMPLLIDGFLPLLPALREQFSAGLEALQWTMGAALLGFAIAQLVLGLLADRFGRKPIVIMGLVVFCLASLVCAFAPSLGAVIACRFAQAFGAAAGPVLGRAMVRDLYSRDDAARILGITGVGVGLAPMLAPLLNGVVVAQFGWRAALATFVTFGSILLAATFARVDETLAQKDTQALSIANLRAAFRLIAGNRVCRGYVLTCAFGFSGGFVFISSAPIVFHNHFGISTAQFGLYFGVPVFGFMAGNALAYWFGGRIQSDRLLARGLALLLCAASVFVLAGTFFPHSILPWLAAMFLYLAGWGLAQPQAQSGALALRPELAGRVSALLGFVQLCAAAMAGHLFALFYHGKLLTVSWLVLAAAALATLSFRSRVFALRRAP